MSRRPQTGRHTPISKLSLSLALVKIAVTSRAIVCFFLLACFPGRANAQNLISNGEFTDGNNGFTTDYAWSQGNIWTEGTYDIVTNPRNAHTLAASYGDHTSGAGMMMVVNGAISSGLRVWSQTVAVQPFQNYVFSFWVSTWYGPTPEARLRARINSTSLNPVAVAPTSLGQWIQFSVPWNSGGATTATLEIIDEETAAGANDFAIDDIAMGRSCAIVVGGWNAARGGEAALITGGDLAGVRADLSTYFPGAVLMESETLAEDFVNRLDILILSAVYGHSDVQIQPLSSAEQSALSSFVSNGGMALLVTDNASYNLSSNSLVEPFGLHVAIAFASGPQVATIVDHTSFPEVTDGPFGALSTIQGSYVAYYDNVGSATTLGTWNYNNQPALAALTVGSGRAIFFADVCLLSPACASDSNSTLRRNVLAFYSTPCIRDIQTRKHSPAGSAWLTVRGRGFHQGASVKLTRNGQPDWVPSDTEFVGSSEIRVRFSFAGKQPGFYDVVLTNPDGRSAILPAGFQIVSGGAAVLQSSLVVPQAVRPGRDYSVVLEYRNDGDGDMPVPLFSITSPQGALMKLSSAEPFTPGPIQVLGVNQDGPAGTLYAGSIYRIPVQFRAPQGGVEVQFNLTRMIADSTLINWSAIEPQVQPPDIDAEAWAAIWASTQAQIGPTWTDYLAKLSGNADYLQQYGNPTYDVRRLLAFEIGKAAASITPRRTLAASVDAFSTGRILPLALVRVAYNSIDQRFRLGPFGRGWSHNYEYKLTRVDANRARIAGPGGGVRNFTNYAGAWQAQPGDFGVLSEQPGVQYLLREKDGLTWRFDPAGVLSYVEEPNGNRLTVSYSSGSLTGLLHSNGESLTLSYNGQGFIQSITDQAGQQTTYQYSGDKLMSVEHPGARTTTYTYNSPAGAAGHALTSIAAPDGTHRYFAYDALGRLTGMSRDNNAEQVQLSYDALGNVQITDALNGNATTRLGAFGELLEAQDALSNRVQLRYDAAFNIPLLTGPDSSAWTASYDSRGNVSSLRDAGAQTISLGSTPDLSRLDWLKDQRNNFTDFASDVQGNLTGITYPDTRTEAFGYDANGNVTSLTNRRGQTITLTYDPEGRVTRKDYPGGQHIDYTYDARSNLLSAADSVTGTIMMEYDARNFLTRIEYPGSRWFTFEYNNAGRRTRRTSHDGYVLKYLYDAAGRIEYLRDAADALIIQYTYDPAGRLSREDKGNGTYTSYEYDAVGRIEHLAHYAPDDSIQSRFDYTYDANGNPLTIATLAGTTTYTYDAIGQLVAASGPGYTMTCHYDAAGNRISITENGTPAAYTTNNMNQYTQAGPVTLAYDADGNMTSKTDASGTTTYTYDVENRLVQIATPSSGSWDYTYDALGNRTQVVHAGQTTRSVHDPGGLVDVAADYDGTGSLIARYSHGWGLVSRTDTTSAAYYAFDSIGNTRILTDAVGAVANQYDYTPFGLSSATTEAIPNPFRYVGRFGVADDGNGLHFMRARYYEPNLGRFVSPDPIGIGGGINLYAYSANRPLVYVDPQGTQFEAYLTASAADELFGMAARFGSAAWERLGILSVRFPFLFFDAPKLAVKVFGGEALTGLPLPPGYATAAGRIFGYYEAGKIGWKLGWFVGGQIERIPFIRSSIYEFFYLLHAAQLPPVPSTPAGVGTTRVVFPIDPNEKKGPDGFGTAQFIRSDEEQLSYTVYFENVASATAPAQEAVITDSLDADLDWATLELGEVTFGSQSVTQLAGLSQASTRVPLDNSNLVVDIIGEFDAYVGRVRWTIRTIDPETNDLPADPLVGFLPPNDVTHRGEGHVTFTVSQKQGLSSGAEIRNTAAIVFDTNPAINTNEVLNTIDAGAPETSVSPLAQYSIGTTFEVSWTGNDSLGSGIQSFDVYVSDNDGPWTVWQGGVTTAAAVFTGELGHTYRFFSIARDNVGFTEDSPDTPDAATTAIKLGDFDFDGDSDLIDLDAFTAVLLGIDTEALHIAIADMDQSGSADGADIQDFANTLLNP